MSDYLESLPTDKDPVHPAEAQILHTILNKDSSTFHRMLYDLKDPIISGILFLLLNTPQCSEFIKSTVSYARSSNTSLLIFKTVLFITIIFVIKNCNIVLAKN